MVAMRKTTDMVLLEDPGPETRRSAGSGAKAELNRRFGALPSRTELEQRMQAKNMARKIQGMTAAQATKRANLLERQQPGYVDPELEKAAAELQQHKQQLLKMCGFGLLMDSMTEDDIFQIGGFLLGYCLAGGPFVLAADGMKSMQLGMQKWSADKAKAYEEGQQRMAQGKRPLPWLPLPMGANRAFFEATCGNTARFATKATGKSMPLASQQDRMLGLMALELDAYAKMKLVEHDPNKRDRIRADLDRQINQFLADVPAYQRDALVKQANEEMKSIRCDENGNFDVRGDYIKYNVWNRIPGTQVRIRAGEPVERNVKYSDFAEWIGYPYFDSAERQGAASASVERQGGGFRAREDAAPGGAGRDGDVRDRGFSEEEAYAANDVGSPFGDVEDAVSAYKEAVSSVGDAVDGKSAEDALRSVASATARLYLAEHDEDARAGNDGALPKGKDLLRADGAAASSMSVFADIARSLDGKSGMEFKSAMLVALQTAEVDGAVGEGPAPVVFGQMVDAMADMPPQAREAFLSEIFVELEAMTKDAGREGMHSLFEAEAQGGGFDGASWQRVKRRAMERGGVEAETGGREVVQVANLAEEEDEMDANPSMRDAFEGGADASDDVSATFCRE